MSEWIPASERLPGHSHDVLICNARTGNRATGFYRTGDQTLGPWGIQARYPFGEVTHWMPLPAPPTDVPSECHSEPKP